MSSTESEPDSRPPGPAQAVDSEPPADLFAALEAILVVADGPVELTTFCTALGCAPSEVQASLTALREEYVMGRRGLRLRETAGGWRLFAAPEYAELVHRAVLDTAPARLTQAALETLAVVAYQQPVSRGRVAGVRGVSVDAVMRTLVSRGLVTEVGQDGASGALLYGTTQLFLDKLGLASLDMLPPLAPLLPEIETFSEAEDQSKLESET